MTNPMWLQKNLENTDEVRDFPNNSGSLRVFSLGEETVGGRHLTPDSNGPRI